jgi:hypothetical protein
MEKISKIIPPSARTVSVDLKNSGVARSGMPSFGREQGVSSAAKKAEMDVITRSSHQHQELMADRIKDPKVRIIEDMANSFFMKNAAPNVDAEPKTKTESEVDFDLDVPEVGGNLDVMV